VAVSLVHIETFPVFLIENPTVLRWIQIRVPSAITISSIDTVCQGTAPSVTWNLQHDPDISDVTPAEAFLASVVSTSETTGLNSVPDDDPTIPAGSYFWIDITAVSGTILTFNLQVNYTTP